MTLLLSPVIPALGSATLLASESLLWYQGQLQVADNRPRYSKAASW